MALAVGPPPLICSPRFSLDGSILTQTPAPRRSFFGLLVKSGGLVSVPKGNCLVVLRGAQRNGAGKACSPHTAQRLRSSRKTLHLRLILRPLPSGTHPGHSFSGGQEQPTFHRQLTDQPISTLKKSKDIISGKHHQLPLRSPSPQAQMLRNRI